ncbi:hypothetical protein CFB39_01745 [Burkholderia sp. AU6039]|nr:hypothetical protein CFB39_01745 [Burkholderia sp. AU6039]
MIIAPEGAASTRVTAGACRQKRRARQPQRCGAPPFSCSDSGRPSGARSFHSPLTAQRRPAM